MAELIGPPIMIKVVDEFSTAELIQCYKRACLKAGSYVT